jgi:hypothetical protein
VFVLMIPTTSDRLEAIKAELTLVLPDVKSSHRCEAIARGLGFATYASALATTKSGSSDTSIVRGDRFTAYLSDHGFDVPATSFYRAAAKAALRDVADRAPKLTIQGISVGGPRRKPDGRWEDFREMNAKFVEARQQLTGDSAAKPFLASLAFLARVTPTKTIRTGTGSYWLKHVAENYACTYPEGGKLGPTYVPNGVLIAAALYAGFRIRTYMDDLGYDHPNVSFNMSKLSLEDLDYEIRPDGTRALARRRKQEMRDLDLGRPSHSLLT